MCVCVCACVCVWFYCRLHVCRFSYRLYISSAVFSAFVHLLPRWFQPFVSCMHKLDRLDIVLFILKYVRTLAYSDADSIVAITICHILPCTHCVFQRRDTFRGCSCYCWLFLHILVCVVLFQVDSITGRSISDTNQWTGRGDVRGTCQPNQYLANAANVPMFPGLPKNNFSKSCKCEFFLVGGYSLGVQVWI